MRVKLLAQEHNTMTPARVQTWTAQSRVQHSYHSATAPHPTEQANKNDENDSQVKPQGSHTFAAI